MAHAQLGFWYPSSAVDVETGLISTTDVLLDTGRSLSSAPHLDPVPPSGQEWSTGRDLAQDQIIRVMALGQSALQLAEGQWAGSGAKDRRTVGASFERSEGPLPWG